MGKVAQIHDSDDGLSYQLEVQLSTDLANIRDVAVVIQEQREEIGTLEKEGKK